MPANFQVKSRFDILDNTTVPVDDTHVVRKIDLDGEVASLSSALSSEVTRAVSAEASLDSKIQNSVDDLVNGASRSFRYLMNLLLLLVMTLILPPLSPITLLPRCRTSICGCYPPICY